MAEAAAPGSPGASTAFGDGERVRAPPETRILCSVLLGKDPKLDSVEQKVMHQNALGIANVVRHLQAHTGQIAAAQVLVVDQNCEQQVVAQRRGVKAKQAEIAALNQDPKFDAGKVSTLSDLPLVWLWAFLRKHVPKGISDAIIQKISGKSPGSVRYIVYFFTGLNSKFPIGGDLLVKELLSAFLLEQMVSTGNRHLNNFFEHGVRESGELRFHGRACGCYFFKQADGSTESLAKFLVHSQSGTQVSLSDDGSVSLPLDTNISDNYNDYTAYFIIMGQKHPCFKKFKNSDAELKKPGAKEMQAHAERSSLKKKQEQEQSNVQADISLSAVVKRRRPKAIPKAAAQAQSQPPAAAIAQHQPPPASSA
mmetsp:Transcript_137827/g.349181  ORF Transcript_137827/g.349181 Transcript_137827/m.349181 type:complete len:366 (-) Transcript_137827:95-1192(-)